MTLKEQVDTIQEAINILLDVEVRVRFVKHIDKALTLLVKVGKDLSEKEIEPEKGEVKDG